MEIIRNKDGYPIFIIRYIDVDDYSATFEVNLVISWECDNTHSVSETELYLKGFIKWDGCSHITFGDKGYIHMCGKGAWDDHVMLMSKLFEDCASRISKFDKNVAGYYVQ